MPAFIFETGIILQKVLSILFSLTSMFCKYWIKNVVLYFCCVNSFPVCWSDCCQGRDPWKANSSYSINSLYYRHFLMNNFNRMVEQSLLRCPHYLNSPGRRESRRGRWRRGNLTRANTSLHFFICSWLCIKIPRKLHKRIL